VLHFEPCPGFAETLNILERVVAEEKLAAEIIPVTLGSDVRLDFPGSPTILADGDCIFLTKRHEAYTSSCRIYTTPEGPKNHLTEAVVRAALRE
jgi:hypothetical protein